VLVRWIKRHTPRDFGYCRSRWCCSTLLLVLFDTQRVKISAETVRRWLHASGLVWRRPRPVLGPADPSRPWKLRKIRELLRDLPDDEAAVFQDEVDLNLNPEIGREGFALPAAAGCPKASRRRWSPPATTSNATWPAQ
jgi:putative transposase